MAIEVRIPKEIMEYQAKIMGGLTGRQLVSSAVAIISMFVIYPISINLFGVDLGQMVALTLILPIWLVGFYKKEGMSFEKYLMMIFNHYRSHKKRYLQTNITELFKQNEVKQNVKYQKSKEREYERELPTKKEKKATLKQSRKAIRRAKKEYRKAKQLDKKEKQRNS
ncbi:MAG: PrgI family protein [Turicibacter sanguinis]|uniref:PrgI family protein n=1 Tax=Turicibacter sanguinis TaxID=154288 RepID=UPI0021D50153|nr:PrgI family protein [Turicibacter sanguinis]MCU7197981.1 PrgI family protein [Turicibacter sanguinis]MDB8576090.1 PrgI family protein [Turicibacter sanguinis]MDB8578895.1 PrgI family protein [Turicibacter sanguinis]MDB8584708.1 PrgI family protein [Turicibacter sanguinis]MDB8587655.1 PrgI family protein [Turicibacter sanguinis]